MTRNCMSAEFKQRGQSQQSSHSGTYKWRHYFGTVTYLGRLLGTAQKVYFLEDLNAASKILPLASDC